jgi:pyroglutamyl-peptidase
MQSVADMLQGFLDVKTNPSWEVARRLPKHLLASDGSPIELIVPEQPIAVSYHHILETAPRLIAEHNPDLIVHIGLKKESPDFNVEMSAPREGYQDVPDENRKVFTRLENRKTFGKAANRLASTLSLERAVFASAANLINKGPARSGKTSSAKKQGATEASVRLSDDVGTYVCGFIYYVSMLEMQKRKGSRDVVFLHVPQLEKDDKVQAGVRVVENLIRELVNGQS